MKKRITIEDVAKKAGVSRQTVSRAINNKGEISPTTKEKVMEAIEQLGYRPNRLAQGMVTQRTRTVGLLLADITNPYFAEVSRSVQDVAQAHDYNVFLCNTDEIAEAEIRNLNSLAAQGVDGIITLATHMDQAAVTTFLDEYEGIPLVMVNSTIHHPQVSVVRTNNFRGSQIVVEYLVQKGHRSIGMLTNVGVRHIQTNRALGFQEALSEHGCRYDMIVAEAPTMDGGYQGTKELLQKYPEITAVFTYNDLMALGAIRACHDQGLRVPDDIAVMGFDDTHPGAMSIPSLSTVRIDTFTIGRESMLRMLALLNEPNQTFPPINLDVQLVLRESA